MEQNCLLNNKEESTVLQEEVEYQPRKFKNYYHSIKSSHKWWRKWEALKAYLKVS